MLPDPFRCVHIVPHEIVHRAAFAMEEERRRYEIWQDEFERQYNVKFGTLKVTDKYCLIFNSEQDYTMFMLRWA
jgi:hypothetical protein